jgi:hypothetical protein
MDARYGAAYVRPKPESGVVSTWRKSAQRPVDQALHNFKPS